MENSILRNQLGQRIEWLRKRSGFNKTTFALMIGISRQYLIGIESGHANPTVDVLERIAAGLDIDMAELFEGMDIDMLPTSGRAL